MDTILDLEGLSEALGAKYGDLRERIGGSGSALVAYSGGVDSALVAWVAGDVLGQRALAVTADSPAVPRRQLEEARRFAARYGLPHEVIETAEVDDPRYQDNAANRCFFCKHELYGRMTQLARQRGLDVVLDGTNADDAGDHRPGLAAAHEHRVRSPLLESGLGKDEVRELSRRADLPTWDKPAAACLSSRVAYGVKVDPETLARIEAGEEALRELGFRQFRVRHHGGLARIEIAPGELSRALDPEMASRFVTIFKELGYSFVTLDLEGYRSGSMNQDLGGEVAEAGALAGSS